MFLAEYFECFAFQQEAGRYPAYKEMVAEYGWLDKCMFTVPEVCLSQNRILLGTDSAI